MSFRKKSEFWKDQFEKMFDFLKVNLIKFTI